jgi:hypothetical protein
LLTSAALKSWASFFGRSVQIQFSSARFARLFSRGVKRIDYQSESDDLPCPQEQSRDSSEREAEQESTHPRRKSPSVRDHDWSVREDPALAARCRHTVWSGHEARMRHDWQMSPGLTTHPRLPHQPCHDVLEDSLDIPLTGDPERKIVTKNRGYPSRGVQ